MKELEPKFVKVHSGTKLEDELKIVFMQQFPVHERVSLEPFFDASVEEAEAWVLEEGGNILGFVTLLRYLGLTYIFYLATDSKYQGRGVGTKLVNFVKDNLSNGLIFLHCEVPLDSQPDQLRTRLKRQAFYERLGFTKVGEEHEWRGEMFQTMVLGPWDEEKVKMFWKHFDPLWRNEDSQD